MKTRKILHSHAKKRAKERFGIQLNKEMRKKIINLIQTGDPACKCLNKVSRIRSEFQLTFEGKEYRVIYDRKRHGLVTFLPPLNEEQKKEQEKEKEVEIQCQK